MFSTRKIARAFRLAGIPEMPQTRQHIMRNIAQSGALESMQKMTAAQIAAVIRATNHSWHAARSEASFEAMDDAVWVGGNVNRLIPTEALK